MSHGLRRLDIVSKSFDGEYINKTAIYLRSRLRSVVVNGHWDVFICRFGDTILDGFGAFSVAVRYSWSNTSVFCFFQDIFNIFTLGMNAPIMLPSG